MENVRELCTGILHTSMHDYEEFCKHIPLKPAHKTKILWVIKSLDFELIKVHWRYLQRILEQSMFAFGVAIEIHRNPQLPCV